MRKYGKWVLLSLGCIGFLASCQCKICTKEDENTVQICRNNYNSEDDYNSALGFYQLGGYNCN